MTEFTRKARFSVPPTDAPVRFTHAFTTDSGRNYHLHLNNCVEIYISGHGADAYVVENQFYPLVPDDIIVITPLEVHQVILHGESVPYERFYFLVPPELLSASGSPVLRAYCTVKRNVPTRIRLPDRERAQMRALLAQLSALCSDDADPATDMMRCGIFLQFLGLMTRQALHMDAPTDSESFPVHPLIRDVLVYVDQQLPHVQTVQEIAAHFHISVPYLSHLFHQSVGTPLKSFIQIKKIAIAKHLLDQGQSVTYACYESGFSDCSYFIRIFRKHVGVTPFRYREKEPPRALGIPQVSGTVAGGGHDPKVGG